MVHTFIKHVRRFVARQVGYDRLRGSLERIEASCQRIATDIETARPCREATPPHPSAEAQVPQARVAELEVECQRLQHDFPAGVTAAVANVIRRAASDAYFFCNLNGVEVRLPQTTLRTMIHCVQASLDGLISLNVEGAHLNWLASRLQPGGTFVDVGASTGAMCIPVSRRHGGAVNVIAFEPARTTNRVLRETLRVNDICNVEVQDCAVSDEVGAAQFWEYEQDQTGQTPWLPEGSSLTSVVIDRSRARPYEVPVTTLDAFFANREAVALAKVMKIDVEGYEVNVLDGGLRFLQENRPFIAIDIHANPFGEGDTEQPVRERLGRLGYQFEKMGHVLTCTPA